MRVQTGHQCRRRDEDELLIAERLDHQRTVPGRDGADDQIELPGKQLTDQYVGQGQPGTHCNTRGQG